MVAPTPRAEVLLRYPVYASDFDLRNDNYLIVGGGGGEGRSGVGNKITLIDTSRANDIQQLDEIDLSRNEDSVTSLSVASSTDKSLTVLAGINSSSVDLARGVNEHLRSFRVVFPTGRPNEKAVSESKFKALGKAALFQDPVGKQDTYQRVIRISPPGDKGQRLAAIATGAAPLAEVVVFNASQDVPAASDVRQRITLQRGEEAGDVDILPQKNGQCELVYCTDYDVCTCLVNTQGKTAKVQPKSAYTTPHADAFAPKKRSKFRAVRYLTPTLLILLSNLPEKKGSELLLLELPEERSRGGKILLRKRLHRGVKTATSIATALLPAASPTQNVQHVIAVASSDISISIFTLDYHPNSTKSLKLRPFTVLKDVHGVQMTSLAFSRFIQPKNQRSAPAQYLKLASTSMDATVVLHTLPLLTYPPGAKEPLRYCLASPSGRGEVGQVGISILITIIMAALGGVLIQAMTEIRGGSPEYLGAKNWLSNSLREKIAVPYMFAEAPVMVSSMPSIASGSSVAANSASSAGSVASSSFSSVASGASISAETATSAIIEAASSIPEQVKQALSNLQSESADQKPLILRDTVDGVTAETHHDIKHLSKHGRKWEDLEHHEKSEWKKKLIEAGEWTEGQLETMLKGVVFGEIGAAVAGAIRG